MIKEYIEPEIKIIEYSLTDIISASRPNTHTNSNGSESINEFIIDSQTATEETTLPDYIVPTDDEWW